MTEMGQDTFACRRTLAVAGENYHYCSLAAAQQRLGDLARLPATLKILLENLLRHEDGASVRADDIAGLAGWLKTRTQGREIAFRPGRVLMQDFTGVPALVDLAAMRDALHRAGAEPERVNPRIPVDLVVDHSVTVDRYASPAAFAANVALEMERNRERYMFLRWGQKALRNFRVVPPGTGICHQVNLEYLARAVWSEERAGVRWAYPDTLVGTDSHTTMINGLGVLGWGVGGIEAEAAMLGQPISMLVPEVIGVRLHGRLAEGVTATDLVLTVTQLLRQRGVVDKFVEFCGPGLDQLPLADRATIANMAPEFGATCAYFPVDQITIDYLRLTGRDPALLELVERYSREQGLWRGDEAPEPLFTEQLELDLFSVRPSLAGPKRPQDRVELSGLRPALEAILPVGAGAEGVAVAAADYRLRHGDVVIAAITSCTNTSNPTVMMTAGLLAQKAVARGLLRRPWVKTSLAPGSRVVSDYLQAAGLQEGLDRLGFHLVGYGCTTCIGNSGPLDAPIAEAIRAGNLTVSAVLSGNRNFEGRIHPQVKASWLASPPLVVAFALAGTTRIDLEHEPLGHDAAGRPVFLRELWPSGAEVAAAVAAVGAGMFRQGYAEVFAGHDAWRNLPVPLGATYAWADDSTYVKEPPYFRAGVEQERFGDVGGARILALLGDSVTTDHISPAGSIRPESPAGRYLQERGVAPADFNAYGARRGNHELMMRGTFANVRLRNEMVPGREGGVTRHWPSGDEVTIFEAAERYAAAGVPLVIVAGREYGSGSSRDWAAKGPRLLGVRAVLAESFERIHRANLVGMGILPLQFPPATGRVTLGLDGSEEVDLALVGPLQPGQTIAATFRHPAGRCSTVAVLCRIDTAEEVAYFRSGGILPFVLSARLIGAGHVA